MAIRPDCQDETLGKLAEYFDGRRKIKFFNRSDVFRDKTKGGRKISSRLINVGPAADIVIQLVGEIQFFLGQKHRLPLFAKN